MKKKKTSERGLVKKLKKVCRKRKSDKVLKAKQVQKYHEKQKTKQHAYHDVMISWRAPEYIKIKKSYTWFVIASLMTILLVVYSLKEGSWSFAMAVMAAAIAYGVYVRQKPKNVEIVVSEMGIKIGKYKIPYSHMRVFWIVYHPPFIQTLNIRTVDAFTPDIAIQLGEQSPVKVREYMVKQVPEWEGKHENFIDSLARLLKL